MEFLLLLYERLIAPIRGTGLRRRFRAIDRAYEALVANLTRGVAYVHGRRMYLDPRDTLALASGEFEPFATQVVTRLVRPGQLVVDVGASIGYYTLIFADLVGPQGKVYAFEPDPTNFALLRRNVRLNHHRNVVLERAAVADRSGQLTLYLAHENVGDHRIFDYYGDRRGLSVPCLRLDDRLAGERIDLIKLDIQGAEWSALRGMDDVLRKNPGVVVLTEYAPMLLAQFGVEPARYLQRLEEQRFCFYDLDERARRLSAASVASLQARYRPETEEHTNLLCTRKLPAALAPLLGS
jgi:FkbM family methyltransferase